MTKMCVRCSTEKPVDDFQRSSRNKDGRLPQCRPCRNEYVQAYRASRGPTLRSAENLRNKYGMTPDEYDALLTAQNGRCAICDRLPSDNARHGRLYVDHHHASGKVRGLLCDQCNRAIGLLQDSPDVIMAAAAYLLTRQIEAPLKEAPNA